MEPHAVEADTAHDQGVQPPVAPPRRGWKRITAIAGTVVAIAGGVSTVLEVPQKIVDLFRDDAPIVEPTRELRLDADQTFEVLRSFAAGHDDFPVTPQLIAQHGDEKALVFRLGVSVSGQKTDRCSLRWRVVDDLTKEPLALPAWAPTRVSIPRCEADGQRELWVPSPLAGEFVRYQFSLVDDEASTTLRQVQSGPIELGGF